MFRCTHSELPAKYGRGEGVGWHEEAQIGSRLEAFDHVRGEVEGDSADLELARSGDVGSGRHAGVIVERRERPPRLLWSRRETPEKTGNPEAHAAFVCSRDGRQSDQSTDDKCRREPARPCTCVGRCLFHVRPRSPVRYPAAVTAALSRWLVRWPPAAAMSLDDKAASAPRSGH